MKERTKKVSIINKEFYARVFFVKIREAISQNKIVTDNRKFWKTLTPLFSEKAFHRECITVKESNKIIANNVKLDEM